MGRTKPNVSLALLMAYAQIIPSFNAGELSPYMEARSDVAKYSSGCRTLENFVVMPYGGIFRRPGTQYLGAAKYSDKRCRLIGFNFSATTSLVLEVGDRYIRFWLDGAPVVNPSSPPNALEVTTTY